MDFYFFSPSLQYIWKDIGGMNKAISLNLSLSLNQMTKSLFVHDLFPTQESMPSMSVLTLHCYLPGARLSLNDTLCWPNQIAFDPLRLNASFPKLQSFAFKRVYPVKDKTINFPWFPNKVPISNGLYRSYYYRHLSYYSTTDLNHTRRIYSLQSTDLKPATIFALKDVVNEVVIRQCNLRSIPWDVFLNVTNLRYLDISQQQAFEEQSVFSETVHQSHQSDCIQGWHISRSTNSKSSGHKQ